MINGCVGQISLFDYIHADKEIHISPVEKEIKVIKLVPQLHVGQKVYLINKADIEEYTVYDEKPWDCGGYLGYRLYDGIGYNCTWDNSIGKTAFTDIKPAKEITADWKQKYEVILSEDIKPIEVKAWHYIRDCDSHEMIAYYGILPDGKAYIRDYMTYAHMIDYKSVENSRKAIQKIFTNKKYPDDNAFDYQPKYKNMYPCKNDSGWQWTESRCSHSMQILRKEST